MNDSACRIAGLAHTLRQVYLLLRIGLPDVLLLRAEPALVPSTVRGEIHCLEQAISRR